MLSFNLNCCFYSVSDEYFKSLWFFQFNSIKHCIESDQKIISASWHSHATTIASNCSLSVSAASNACITKVVNLYFAILLNCSQRFILKFLSNVSSEWISIHSCWCWLPIFQLISVQHQMFAITLSLLPELELWIRFSHTV